MCKPNRGNANACTLFSLWISKYLLRQCTKAWVSNEKKMDLITDYTFPAPKWDTHSLFCKTHAHSHTQVHADWSRVWEVTVVSVSLRLAVATSSGRQELLAPLYYYYRCCYYYGCYCKPRKHPGRINKENMYDGPAADNHRRRGEKEKNQG